MPGYHQSHSFPVRHWGPVCPCCHPLLDSLSWSVFKGDRLVMAQGYFFKKVSFCLKWRFIGVRSWVLLFEQGNSLFEHSHLSLVPLDHRHHLRLQFLQLVLMLLLCFLIGSHKVTVGSKKSNFFFYYEHFKAPSLLKSDLSFKTLESIILFQTAWLSGSHCMGFSAVLP